MEPPSPIDFPTAGSWISKFLPPTEPVLPFVEMPRPLQESDVVGKGGAAGFIGYHLARKRLDIDDTVVGVDNINDYYDPNLKLDRLKDLENTAKSKKSAADKYKFFKIDLKNKDKLVELLFCNHGVRGSIPLCGTTPLIISLEQSDCRRSEKPNKMGRRDKRPKRS